MKASVGACKRLPLLPATESGLSTLRDLETRFQRDRQRPADVLAGWSSDDPALTRVARAIGQALDDHAGRVPEPAYHNRHHFAEAVVAMGTLCRIACAENLLSQRLADLGLLAMVGHDLGHDGSLALPGVLESRAAEAVLALAEALGPADREILAHVIRHTDATTVPSNLARARAPGATALDHLTALANEADVLASLLPGLGLELSELLAAEWQPHDAARAAAACSFGGRVQFLTVYASPTGPGRTLGLEGCIAGQLRAITPDMDLLPRAEAVSKYRKQALLF